MGKTIFAEDGLQEYISLLYGEHPWLIGLIVGQVSYQLAGVFY